MPDSQTVIRHYSHDSLLKTIQEGLAKLDKSPEALTIDDLAPVDEFHIGGRVATEQFLDQLDIEPSHKVLDVGCGLGGSSRFAAQHYGCQVTGVDLTPDYIETGRELCRWVGLDERVELQTGDAAALPLADASIDRAFMLHVGMNIADKSALVADVYRVLRPGGRFGIYDVMRTEDGELRFPVPWAASVEGNAVASPQVYKDALAGAGFKLLAERNRRDFAVEFFDQLQARTEAAGGPPPLGLHLLMGEEAPTRVKTLRDNIGRNVVAPVELIAEKPA